MDSTYQHPYMSNVSLTQAASLPAVSFITRYRTICPKSLCLLHPLVYCSAGESQRESVRSDCQEARYCRDIVACLTACGIWMMERPHAPSPGSHRETKLRPRMRLDALGRQRAH